MSLYEKIIQPRRAIRTQAKPKVVLDKYAIFRDKLSNEIIEKYNPEQLYELYFDGSANYFDSKYFDKEKDQEEKYLADIGRNIKVSIGSYECPSCKSNRIIINQKQLRSGDEAADTFALCSRCNYSWKIRG